MCKYIAEVEFTLQSHVEEGLFDSTEEEKAQTSVVYNGKLLGFSAESRSGDNAQTDIVPVGIILDQNGDLQSIPVNRIKFVRKEELQ